MPDFDPDAYLKDGAGFDPDRYLRGFDVGASVAEVANSPVVAKPDLPGNTPRLVSPTAPERAQIARDEAIASTLNAETPEHAATRRLEGAAAHSQDAIPFFPHVRGAVAAGLAAARGINPGMAYSEEVKLAAKQ